MSKNRRICSTFLVVVLLVVCGLSTLADKADIAGENKDTVADIVNTYDEYLVYKESFKKLQSAKENIVIGGAEGIASDDADVEIKTDYLGANNPLLWTGNGSVKYGFYVPENAVYNIRFNYAALDDNGMDIKLTVLIDGEIPFSSAKKITLPRMWKDSDSEFRTDGYGNQFASEQTDYDAYVTRPLYDSTGIITTPYEFAFTAGNHEITLIHNSGKLAIAEIIIAVPDKTEKSYTDVLKDYETQNVERYDGEALIVEGEKTKYKNSSSIIPLSDNTSKLLTPSSSDRSLVNYIGSTNWQNAADEITWEVAVPKDGIYKLGLMYKQDKVVNGISYRHLKIDGYTPFAEASHIAFPYCLNWEFYEFADNNGNDYLFYLTKGIHELSLSVTMGETAEFYSRLKAVTEELGDLYIDIVMITGESPDVSRDYELFKQIPNFNEVLEKNFKELNSLKTDIQEYTGKRSNSLIAAIANMSRVINSMKENKYSSHIYLSDFYSNYVTLSSWLYEMTVMPLSIDQIRLAAPDKNFGEKNVSIVEKLAFSMRRFLLSFSNSYLGISGKSNSNSLKIWVNWGRDQTQVLNSLIKESFTAKYGINVNLEITNASLVNGMLSGNAPDLSLHLSRATPVNLAMRGALYDLTNFDDYNDVLKRFGNSSAEPYEYNGGVYALPDTQSFYLMFYRTDIFKQLKLETPNTWEEFLANTAVLQRNNMEAYIPYTKITAATTTDTGVGGLNLYATLLMQKGGSLYNKEKNESLFNSVLSLSAFKYWTDMYTQYKIPTEMDFYNRFKVGTCPMGVSVYTTYTTLLQAAPEIQGRWGIAPVPGVKDESGHINRTVSGSGTGCAILNSTKNKTQAWEFLKWWTSADTQERYNSNVESILGAVSRVTTANVEAFSKMGWESEDLDILLEQRSYIKEIPEVPGSYYLSRAVDQAYWAVINKTSSVKDSVDKWGKEANQEIRRKISEYSGENNEK